MSRRARTAGVLLALALAAGAALAVQRGGGSGRPQPRGARWSILLRDGARVEGAATASGDVLETQVGPLRLVVVWEDLDRDGAPDPGRHTSFLTNSQAGRGKVYWSSLELRVDGRPVLELERGVLPPRYCLARTSLSLGDLARIPETAKAPAELRRKGLAQVDAARSEWVGPYRFFIPAVDGGADSTGPGGRSTAPFHGGRRDWARRFREGLWYRIHEALGAMHRGLWLQEEDGSPWLPGPYGVRYWWDASTLQYAREWQQNNGLPGWAWAPATDGWVEYEATLARRPISDFSHSGRWYKAVAAVAQDLRFGTWLLVNVVWPEHARSYSMDRRVPATADPNLRLYNPLWYFVERTAETPRFKNIDRREAHAIEILTEAAPFLPAETVELYTTGWTAFVTQVADERGLVDHSRQGDAAASGLPGNVTMFFQNAMVITALYRLSELDAGAPVREVALDLALWWGATPPYFASTSGQHPSALDAPHKGTGTRQYVWCTLPELAPPWQQVLQGALAQTWGEPDLDYHPRAW